MAMFIALIAVSMVVVAVPLLMFAPVGVFYLFAASTIFGNILYGYVATVGNLGMPRAWHPADFLSILTILAAMRVTPDRTIPSSGITKSMRIVIILSVITLMIGFARYSTTTLPSLRYLHFLPALIFAGRYYTTEERFKSFIRFTVFILLIMFIVHLGIRFGVIEPPSTAREDTEVFQLGGARGGRSISPILYLALISIALGKLSSKTGKLIWICLLLLIGSTGIALSETRSLVASLGFLAIVALVFNRRRIKAMFVWGLIGVIVLPMAVKVGFDVMARFRREGQGEIVNPLEQLEGGWRLLEYSTIIGSFRSEPYFLLSGRGIGAIHYAEGSKMGFVSFYHCEYLGYIDTFGIVGFFALMIAWAIGLFRSFQMSRSDTPSLCFFGTTMFLLIIALLLNGMLHPILVAPRTGAMAGAYLALVGNWQSIWNSVYAEQFYPRDYSIELHEQYLQEQYDLMEDSY